VPAVPTEEKPPSRLLTETIDSWKTLVEDDGLAFYPDWSTNTMYDTMTSGMQGLLGGNLEPEAYVKRLQSDYGTFKESRS
jgi:raffinose/stachyose/melibiose transport system substrate-binding protein